MIEKYNEWKKELIKKAKRREKLDKIVYISKDKVTITKNSKEVQWNIDFINQNITLSRKKPNFKPLKKFSSSDEKYLIYENSMDCFIISFHLRRFKNPIFFAGMEAECEVLGKIISKNIQRNFYYRGNRFSKKSLIKRGKNYDKNDLLDFIKKRENRLRL